jgi:hypothetical protein
MEIRTAQDNEYIEGIFSTRVPIQHGEGTAILDLSNFGADPLSTNQLIVTMLDANFMPFYSETIAESINWGVGSPDLSIPQAWVDRPNQKLNIKVQNQSCGGPPAETPLISFVRESDGQTGFHQFTENIRANSQKLVSIDLFPQEMDLWAGEINLTIDPLDNVNESDEDNNNYQIGEARIKRVVFTQSIVYDDHDWNNDGEWDLRFYVCNEPCLYYEAPTINFIYDYWWGPGSHTIDSVFFTPNVESDDILVLGTWGYEKDVGFEYGSNTSLGKVKVYHTPDGVAIPALDAAGYTHMGSWKNGGTFPAMSDKGDYEIIYEIVMEN